MVFPMFSFVMPSFFSTPSSTGNPCVSQPAFRSTRNPCKVLYLQIISLIVLAITWWIPGIPFADGGPSKKTNEGCPSLFFKLCSKVLFDSHSYKTSLFTWERSKPLYSWNFLSIVTPDFKILLICTCKKSSCKYTIYLWIWKSSPFFHAFILLEGYKWYRERVVLMMPFSFVISG